MAWRQEMKGIISRRSQPLGSGSKQVMTHTALDSLLSIYTHTYVHIRVADIHKHNRILTSLAPDRNFSRFANRFLDDILNMKTVIAWMTLTC